MIRMFRLTICAAALGAVVACGCEAPESGAEIEPPRRPIANDQLRSVQSRKKSGFAPISVSGIGAGWIRKNQW